MKRMLFALCLVAGGVYAITTHLPDADGFRTTEAVQDQASDLKPPSQPRLDKPLVPDAPHPKSGEVAAEEGWVRLNLAAAMHSDASIDSPTIGYYPANVELRAVARLNGWVKVLDPKTEATGWIYEKYYVSSIDAPSGSKDNATETAPRRSVTADTNQELAKQARPIVQKKRKVRPKASPSEVGTSNRDGSREQRRGFGFFRRRGLF
jgi:SH3 domain-containing protein